MDILHSQAENEPVHAAMATVHAIAHFQCDIKEKFGAPRQSGLARHLTGRIVFEPQYRKPEMLRGLVDFSHIWIIWLFSKNFNRWTCTVRPPRLGGNKRMGVLACRSPFRPNPIGLSCVRIEKIALRTQDGPVICVSGADLIDGTPIIDIKPYIPYADCIMDASSGFVEGLPDTLLSVSFSVQARQKLNDYQRKVVTELLELDPRPRYHADRSRVYGMRYAHFDISFRVGDGHVEVFEVSEAELL